MAIYHSFKDEKEKTGGACRTVIARECFYCGKELEYPRILWSGYTAEIWLHPDCVVLLNIRLCRDVWESQTIYKSIVSVK